MHPKPKDHYVRGAKVPFPPALERVLPGPTQ